MMDNAIDELKAQLAKPISDREDGMASVEEFDPWEIFPSLYGSYSSEFDDMAILVLGNIINKRWGEGEGLAHEIFREMLCTAGLCDYGTSPRGCFPNYSIKGIEEMLTALLEKWRAYRIANWGALTPDDGEVG